MPLPAASVAGMEAQLRLQEETSQKLRALRKQHGMLTFGSVEATPVVEGGQVKDLAFGMGCIPRDGLYTTTSFRNIGG